MAILTHFADRPLPSGLMIPDSRILMSVRLIVDSLTYGCCILISSLVKISGRWKIVFSMLSHLVRVEVEFVFVHDGLGLLITLEDEAEDETDESERLRQPFLPVDAGVLQFLQKPGIFAV